MVRDKPDRAPRRRRARSSGRATRRASELANVHLSNLPENLAFFSGAIDAAGSFGGIYQSAVLAYGSDVIKDPPDPSASSIRRAAGAREGGACSRIRRSRSRRSAPARRRRSRPTRCSARTSGSCSSRTRRRSIRRTRTTSKNLDAIKQLLQVSPGSTLLLRGHVDNAQVEEFRKQGGEAFVRTQALRAMELSKNRAAEIRKLLIERYNIDPKRIDIVGRGWEEPAGPTPTRTGGSKCSGSHDRIPSSNFQLQRDCQGIATWLFSDVEELRIRRLGSWDWRLGGKTRCLTSTSTLNRRYGKPMRPDPPRDAAASFAAARRAAPSASPPRWPAPARVVVSAPASAGWPRPTSCRGPATKSPSSRRAIASAGA